MNHFSSLDFSIIIAFFTIIVIVGLVMARVASRNIENYYLGGRKVPWYMLGMSGMSSWFDLTGTMIITSFLFLLGPKGIYIEFRGGAVLVLAFFIAYTAKWHRRSGCMTAAEWAVYRFGSSLSGEVLRVMSAILGIVTTIGFLSYLIRGATLFLGMIFPYNTVWMTLGILGIAGLYTVIAGFYGVIFTDMFAGLVMIAGCIALSYLAWITIPDGKILAENALKVTGIQDWTSSLPHWKVSMPRGYEAYNMLGMAALFYLARNLVGGAASGSESRIFAARNPREASMQGLMQGIAVMFRWPLMISFAALGIMLVAKIMPETDQLLKVREVVMTEVPSVTPERWHSVVGQLAETSESTSPQFVSLMLDLLGENWRAKLLLVGSQGTIDPEMIIPAVLIHMIPSGLRGLLMVSLIAALMGTLSGTVNGSSAFFVRDIYQNLMRKTAGNKELIGISYLSSAIILLISFVMGLSAANINDLWGWVIMGLTSGALGPRIIKTLLVADDCLGNDSRNLHRWAMCSHPAGFDSRDVRVGSVPTYVDNLPDLHHHRFTFDCTDKQWRCQKFLQNYQTIWLLGTVFSGAK